MIRATWKGAVLAEADETIVVEGNHYFAPGDVRFEHLKASSSHTRCPWKGTASYYTVAVDGHENRDAAWYYPEPSSAAQKIAGRVAFWGGVRVEKLRAEDGTQALGASWRRGLSHLLHR